jgi:hypothetical protein
MIRLFKIFIRIALPLYSFGEIIDHQSIDRRGAGRGITRKWNGMNMTADARDYSGIDICSDRSFLVEPVGSIFVAEFRKRDV